MNPEEHYFKEYYSTYHEEPIVNLDLFSSQKILELWLEFEHFIEQKKRLGLLHMYYNDVLLCYGISEQELKEAYTAKFKKNMTRW